MHHVLYTIIFKLFLHAGCSSISKISIFILELLEIKIADEGFWF